MYCTDAQITARMPSLTGTVIDDSTKRDTFLRTPAKAWVDSVFPYGAPFADVTASPPTPSIIQQGCLEYALFLGWLIFTKAADNPSAKACLENALRLFQIDPKGTGQAQVFIAGLDSTSRLGVVDVVRNRTGEQMDTRDGLDAILPGGGE